MPPQRRPRNQVQNNTNNNNNQQTPQQQHPQPRRPHNSAQNQNQHQQQRRGTSNNNRDHDSETDEEEPDGEDLFDEHALDRDYQAQSDSDEGNDDGDIRDEDDDGFLVDDDDSDLESDMSDTDRMKVDAVIERRRKLEADIAAEERGRKKRRANNLLGGDGGDGDGDGDGGGGDDDDDDDDYYSDEEDDEDGIDAFDDGNSNNKRRKNARGKKNANINRANRFFENDNDDDDGRRNNNMMMNNNGEEDGSENDADNPYVFGEIGDDEIQWSNPRGDVADWLEQDAPRRIIKNRIFNFIWSFDRKGRKIYQEAIHLMARENAQSFEISYIHFGEVHDSVLAVWLAEVPEAMLDLINEAANAVVYNFMYPHYHRVHKSIRVRISDLPICDPIRDFRQVHRDVLVRVEGVITRRSPVYPQLQAVRYDCTKCGFILGPVMQRSDAEVKVSQCPSCHSKGPFKINMALTEFRSHQSIVLQEPPGKVPPGRLPRSLEVTLTHDLIDRAKPGEEVEVIGVYKNTFDPVLNSRQGFPVFTTVLIANNITKRTVDVLHYRLPDNERQRLIRLARHPHIKKKLMASIAPSIHGRNDIKLGLLLVLLGGVAKEHNAHRIRGDINALLVGDPGTAKSQFLKFVEKTADRAVFTTGRGSTAVGLTASVHKDPVSGEFSLEGGALVIADRGVCLIDEFDKMSDQDRTSIHEAMEQQTISVARGGIVTTLCARCSVVAAANPVGGRYDSSLSFDANVDLTTPILSRFDLLFVVRDEVNPEEDTRLAEFITRSHQRSHPAEKDAAAQRKREYEQRIAQLVNRLSQMAQEQQRQQRDDDDLTAEEKREREALEHDIDRYEHDLRAEQTSKEDEDPSSSLPLPQALLRKYILFARSQVRPRISQINGAPLETLFRNLRQESKRGGGIPVTVRHLESILRLSEAHARLHLREFVTDEDVSAAMSLFLRCFLQTQKYSMRSALELKFREFLESDIEPQHLILNRLRTLVHNHRAFERQISGVEPAVVSIECEELISSVAAMNVGRAALEQFYDSQLFVQGNFTLIRDGRRVPIRIEHVLRS